MILLYSRWAATNRLAPAAAAIRRALPAAAALSTVSYRPRPAEPSARRRPQSAAPRRPSAARAFPAAADVGFGDKGGLRAFSASSDPPPAAAAPDSAGSAADPPSAEPPFSKILVANRGEIALRVMRTCSKLGIRTVAVHSTVDSRSPHVQAADEAVCVGPAASSASYLNVDAVCRAIQETGAEAVHPGYGFLSENSEFAKRIESMGVKFIGPSVDAIVAMGDKIQSKKLAREANVSVIPGFDGVIKSPDEAVRIAKEVGYPVMIKATAGGGGKGMRICRTDEQVIEGYQLSTAEAKSFFNDERLFIERYIENPHHIEFQVLAGRKRLKKAKAIPAMNPFPFLDGKEYGDLEILVFPERECSIQRRNQKIIEESPSCLLKPETRAEMVKQVKSLVRRVEYHSAGTVEFLVDEQQNFFFLEMNTRLQVEHPITEMVTGGVDLVRGMIDVAGGRGVPEDYLALVGEGGTTPDKGTDAKGQVVEDSRVVPHNGHAIEARVYAEDPLRGFLPSIGPLLAYAEPPCISHTCHIEHVEGSTVPICPGGSVIRVDSGVREGSAISQYYDPMISKLVAYSPHGRDDAIVALGDALDRYVIRGVGHNASFASDVLRHPGFIAGRTPTNFIETNYPEGFGGVTLTEGEREEMAAIGAVLFGKRREALDSPDLPIIKEGGEVAVCLGGMFGDAYSVRMDGEQAVVRKLHRPSAEDAADVPPPSSPRSVRIACLKYCPTFPVVDMDVDGLERAVQIGAEDNSGEFPLRMYGAEVPVVVMSPAEYELSLTMTPPQKVDTSDLILSPMPGTLMSYAVEEGDHVEIGQEICVVEAMKMQNVIRSERTGTVERRRAELGASLAADEVIVEFAREGEEEEAA